MSEIIDVLPAILIPACASSSLAFSKIYSAYMLNTLRIGKISRVIIYSLDVLLSRFGTSLFPCPVLLLLVDLQTDFSGGRSGGLVFPSLSEFSTICCDPHNQRLLHSQ